MVDSLRGCVGHFVTPAVLVSNLHLPAPVIMIFITDSDERLPYLPRHEGWAR